MQKTSKMQIRAYEPGDEPELTALWGRCDLIRPWNDPAKDIRRKLRVGREMFLVGLVAGRIVASVMAGYDGHRGWLNYVAVCPEHRRRGYGRTILAEAERLLRAAGCPKINLQIRRTNSSVIAFYEKAGFAMDDVASMGKRLERDDKPEAG